MNMISTGAFQNEMDASNKQQELVKKLTAAWEKKNSKAARAGGVSLMALSLAACGDEDDTPFSQADVDAAVAASEARERAFKFHYIRYSMPSTSSSSGACKSAPD